MTIERTGLVPDHSDDWLPTIEPPLAEIRAEAEALIRADRSWKVTDPITLMLSDDWKSWRIHCTLDTETGDTPILPGDPVACREKGCQELVERTFGNRCQGCGYHFCDRHRQYGTCSDGESRTFCLDCRGPSDPWGPVA